MNRQAGSIALGVMIVLALSLLANVWLWNAKASEHDARVKAETGLSAANAATQACNDSIAGLEEAARQRGAAQEKQRAAAAERRRRADQSADRILATPATVPGDDCRSAQDRVAAWLKGRTR